MQALHLLLDNVHTSVWLTLSGIIYLGLTIWACIHVLLHKERESSAIAWFGVILLSPGIGLVLYWLLGINRIKRRARREFGAHSHRAHSIDPAPPPQAAPASWQGLMQTGQVIHNDRYENGNRLTALIDGRETYPAMLDAIDTANHSIVMSSYIFDYDVIGRQFVHALGRAHRRGVEVRVLIDGIGIGYSFSWTKTDRALHRYGIPTARFLPTLSRSGTRFINLRNHRKILSIDGHVAFLGGINIRDHNLPLTPTSRRATQDLHFRLQGPVINQVNSLFADDWQFACGEALDLPRWTDAAAGHTICRVLPDGPDDNYLKLQLTLNNVINSAQQRIAILTPYFLPGPILMQAVKLACLRGVNVEIILPSKSNIPFVDWAFRANLPALLSYGVKLYFSPAPFDHSKLLLVDDGWCLIGSSNWDVRSLELNFEVNLECFDQRLSTELSCIFADKRNKSTPIEHIDHRDRVLPWQLRNNFFRLLSPYL